MSIIVLRSVKGTPLTNTEVDANFNNLNTDKLEAATTATLSNKTINLTSNTLVATSAQLRAAVTDETGTGSLVFATSPTLVTPALGTPTALVGTNITGTAAGLSIGGNATTATTATNQSGGSVNATTGAFSGALTSTSTIQTNSGYIASGVGSGATALTTNDGYGNASLTFNHTNGIPDFTGSSARIVASVDSPTASLLLQVGNNTTSGTPLPLATVLNLSTSAVSTLVPLSVAGTATATSFSGAGTGLTGTAAGLTIGGSAATLTTARTLTIGQTGKTFNGSANVAWSTEEILPDRLRERADNITDWNLATENGWYMGFDTANAPSTGWYIGFVESHNAIWTTQTIHAFSSDSENPGLIWRREQNNGIWGSWYRLQWSQAEQDARYVSLTQDQTIAGDKTFSESLAINRDTPTDFWGSGLNSALTLPYGYLGSNGAYAISLFSNGYRNSSGTWTSQAINGYTSGSAIQLLTVNGDITFHSDAVKASGSSNTPTERMRITNAGNVGIGTSSPSAQLEIAANTTTPALLITQTGTGNALVVEDSTSPDSTPFVIDASGNVIVGYTAPISVVGTLNPLQVLGTSNATATIATARFSNDAASSYIDILKSRGTSVGSLEIVQSNDGIGSIRFIADDGTDFNTVAAQITAAVDGTPGANDMPGRLMFSTTADGASSPTERMRITSAGNLMVGTSAGAEGSITAADYLQIRRNTDGWLLKHQRTDNSQICGLQATGHSSIVSLSFLTANTERMRITSAGNVGIGTGSPTDKLQINTQDGVRLGASGPVSYVRIGSALTSEATGEISFDRSVGATIFSQGSTGSALNERMRITNVGNVGIGTDAPTDKLSVSGTLGVTGEATVGSLTIADSDDSIVADSSISSWTYDKDFSVAVQDTEPRDLSFSSDGTKMYILGNSGNDINQYTLSTAWDVSTAVYLQVFSVSAQEPTPYGLYFKPDGTKFYICGSTVDTVYEYNVATAWNISTSTFLQSFSVNAKETDPNAVAFSSDGTKMYVTGTSSDSVHQYNLSTAWSVVTAVFASTFSVSAYAAAPQGLDFDSTGTKMYIVGSTFNRITEFALSTPWTLSTATFSGTVNAVLLGVYITNGLSGIHVEANQNKAYITDYNTDRVFQLSTDIAATRFTGSKFLMDGDLHLEKDLLVYNNLHSNNTIYARSNIISYGNASVAGTLDVRGAIDLADSDVLRLGSSDDWEFFHNGADNYMDLNVGNLIIRDNTTTRFTFDRTTGNLTGTGNLDFSKFLGLATDLVTTPSFTWTGDLTTGFYRPAASQIGVAIAGVQRGLFTSSGLTVTGSLGWTGATYENVFTITDGASVDLNPANGTIQLWTLAASRSPTATSFTSGQSMTLMIADGTAYAITWPSVTWKTDGGVAPTLNTTGFTAIALWKVSTVLYGARVGDA